MGGALAAYIEKHRSTWAAQSALAYDSSRSPGNLSNAGGTKDAAHPYGPYLRRIPPLPVGTNSIQVRPAGTLSSPADLPTGQET